MDVGDGGCAEFRDDGGGVWVEGEPEVAGGEGEVGGGEEVRKNYRLPSTFAQF